MIQNESGFIGDASNPATVGGLVGSMFFLGYMLTQYPGGRLGDRFGHREMIIVSLLAAGVLTIVSGLVAGLVAFVAARVLTGLGEGVFYSKDRKSTRLNSSHANISYAVFCLKKKKIPLFVLQSGPSSHTSL